MPHKETIKYNGQDIEVITFDTVVHITRSKSKVLGEIGTLLKEASKYERDGKLTHWEISSQ